MKLTGFLSAAILSAFVFSSCQKELTNAPAGTDTTGTTNTNLVRRYSEDLSSPSFPDHITDTFDLRYDGSNRIVSLISIINPGNKFLFTYNTNNTFTTDLYDDNALSVHELFFVNSIGYVDSTLQYNDTQDTLTEKYIYNSNKQLVQLNEYDYTTATGATLTGSETYLYDNTGNITTQTSDDAMTTFTYTSFANTLNTGLIYFQQSKLLPDKVTTTFSSITQTATHTYLFDDANRLTQDKAVTGDGDVIVKTYWYE